MEITRSPQNPSQVSKYAEPRHKIIKAASNKIESPSSMFRYISDNYDPRHHKKALASRTHDQENLTAWILLVVFTCHNPRVSAVICCFRRLWHVVRCRSSWLKRGSRGEVVAFRSRCSFGLRWPIPEKRLVSDLPWSSVGPQLFSPFYASGVDRADPHSSGIRNACRGW